MEENIQQESVDNSIDAKIKKQIKMLEICPLGTYWKKIYSKNENIETEEYFNSQSLNEDGRIEGERLVHSKTHYYFDDTSLYDFSFDQDRIEYYIESSKEEYDNVKTEVIKKFETAINETSKRKILFDVLKFEEALKFNDIMDIIRQFYDFSQKERLAECKIYFFGRFHKNELNSSEVIDRFHLYEIDILSVDFKSKKQVNNIGFVGGAPFEENGDNFSFKIRNYNQSISYKNLSHDYWNSKIRLSIENGISTQSLTDENGWYTYVATKDKYTNGSYKCSNNPGIDVYQISNYHFEQLLELINNI